VQSHVRQNSDGALFDVSIHYENEDFTKLFISETMTVKEFIDHIKLIKHDYRYLNLEIFSYDSQAKKCSAFPMAENDYLLNVLRMTQDDFHVFVKKKNN